MFAGCDDAIVAGRAADPRDPAGAARGVSRIVDTRSSGAGRDGLVPGGGRCRFAIVDVGLVPEPVAGPVADPDPVADPVAVADAVVVAVAVADFAGGFRVPRTAAAQARRLRAK